MAVAAVAAVTDRVRIGGSSTTRFFAETSFVAVTSPAELDTRRTVDGRSGGWEGPPCEVAGRPELATPVAMSWSVYFSRSASPEAAARESFTFEWETVQEGSVAVPHVVAGRTVGTIPGIFVLTDSGSDVGYHESAVGFPLGRGVFRGVEVLVPRQRPGLHGPEPRRPDADRDVAPQQGARGGRPRAGRGESPACARDRPCGGRTRERARQGRLRPSRRRRRRPARAA